MKTLLAGEYRCGDYCAANWLKIPGLEISLFTDISGGELARKSYPNASIVAADYDNKYTSTRKMFMRWASYIDINNFSDDTYILVSRPDLFLFYINDLGEIKDSISAIVDHNTKTANDVLFVIKFGLFKKLIVEYENFNKNPFEFLPHEYLYHFFTKHSFTYINLSLGIYRPIIPEGTDISWDSLDYYNRLYKCLI